MRSARIVVVVAVALLIVVAYHLGVIQQFANPAQARQTLVHLGSTGYVAFVIAYAVLQPFGVPGTVFVLVAPLIWPWPVAFGLSMIGTMAASVIGFSFARFVARDWLASKIPSRFAKYDEALARRGFATVFVLRLVFWMPQVLHTFLGVSKVRFWTHFWGSFFGYLLPLFLMSYFGQKVFDAVRTAPPSVWIGLAVAVLLIAVVGWQRRRRQVTPVISP
jgi:uncharacterized membrane protein YdjX (TVP38/TMEM64 family)